MRYARSMIAFIWIVAALGLVVWSLVAWGLYRLLVLDPTWLGELGPLIDKVPFADWLDVWVPGWQQLLRFGIEITESLLGWLGGAAPWVVGVTWASGALAC